MTSTLTSASTCHGIGARLLREYAEQIGLDAALPRLPATAKTPRTFVDLVRHEKGFFQDGKSLPNEGNVPLDLLALRQRRDADRAGRRHIVSMVFSVGSGTKGTVRGLCRGQAEAERARLRRSPARLGADRRRRRLGRRHRWPLRSHPVDEYQDTNRLQSSILLALKPGGQA